MNKYKECVLDIENNWRFQHCKYCLSMLPLPSIYKNKYEFCRDGICVGCLGSGYGLEWAVKARESRLNFFDSCRNSKKRNYFMGNLKQKFSI